MARGCTYSSGSGSSVARLFAVVALVCIAGAAAVVPVHAVNGLDGAMATFFPGSRCSPSSDPSLPLLQLSLATCLPNITFNSSVVGVVEHGRLSVWDTADYYHDKCIDPYYFVNFNVLPDVPDCGTGYPPGGDVDLSYWHCVNDGDGDGVCCGLGASGLVFAHANVTYRSVAFTPRTNPKICGPGDWPWWAWLLIVLLLALLGVAARAVVLYCRRRNLERYRHSQHMLFDNVNNNDF